MPQPAHAELSGSGSHRWIRCPGSVLLIRSLKRVEKPTSYGREGTFAHAVGAHILNGGSLKPYLEGMPFEFEDHGVKVISQIPPEMPEYVMVYVNWVREQWDTWDYLHVEEHVSLEFVREGMFGTLDAGVAQPETLVVADLKYGYIPVHLVDYDLVLDSTYGELGHLNSQLLYYAAGLAHKYGWRHKEVTLAVIQPRCIEVPDVQTATVKTSALKYWAEETLWAAAHAATTAGAPLVVGSQCNYCPALDVCPAAREAVQAAAGVDFADVETEVLSPKEVDTSQVSELTSEELSRTLQWRGYVEAWFDARERSAFERLLAGGNVTGFKLVEGRKHRVWPTKDPKELADALNKHLPQRKQFRSTERLMSKPGLLSPSEVEKIIGETAVKAVAVKPKGELEIAPNSDKRHAELPPGDDFTDIEEKEIL